MGNYATRPIAGQAINVDDPMTTGLGSIAGSMAHLEGQPWWSAFREGRTSTQLIDDVLWVGHFCAWLQLQRIAIERCTNNEVDTYLATIASFRPGPRSACRRTVTALIDFLATSRVHSGARSPFAEARRAPLR